MSKQLESCPICGCAVEIYFCNPRCSNDKCPLHYDDFSIGDWQRRPLENELRHRLSEAEAACLNYRTEIINVKEMWKATIDRNNELELKLAAANKDAERLKEAAIRSAPHCEKCKGIARYALSNYQGFSYRCEDHKKDDNYEFGPVQFSHWNKLNDALQKHKERVEAK